MAYLSKDVAFVSHSLSLSVRETHLQQGFIHHCRINEDKLHKCMCVYVNIYSLLIVRVMKPLYSKYRWRSILPLKKNLWTLFGWLSSDFCCLCKSLCCGCCHSCYVTVSGSAFSLVELFYSTSYNWIGMVDFRNIPQFLGNKEIWETLVTACRIVYPNTNNKQKM